MSFHWKRVPSLLVDGEGSASEDTADTVASVGSGGGTDSDVTVLTPISTPRVLDGEGLLGGIAGGDIETDDQHGVIKSITARLGDDTATIELPGRLVSFNGNRDGLLDGGRKNLGEGLLGDTLVSAGVGSDELDVVGDSARLLVSLVGVELLEGHAGSVGIDHGDIRPAAIATVARLGTVDQLLLREGQQDVLGDLVETLKGAGGGESPAGAAVTLVLDGGDGTLGSPVEGLGGGGGEGGAVNGGGAVLISLDVGGLVHASGLLLEFLTGEVSELVDLHGEGLGGVGVVGEDGSVVGGEDGSSQDLLGGGVFLVVFGLPVSPEVVNVSLAHLGDDVLVNDDTSGNQSKSNKQSLHFLF